MRPYPILLILIIFSFSKSLLSQDNAKPYKLTVNGFVRADAIFDSRQVVEAREGFLLFYPKKPLPDANGKDINANPAFNQYAMTTRLTAKATGPDVLGAEVLALIESDFTGASNAENNSLRLRHAYLSLQWTRTRLLIGQYWHPIDLPEMIPNVLSLNTGAPFHSFSRQPQIRLDQKAGKLNFVLVAASQRDYVNNGPDGNNSIYIRNSVIPNLDGQIQYKGSNIFAGVAFDYKMLTPRIATDSNYIADEHLNCYSYSGFVSFNTGGISVKAQYTYGQALNDHLMMGGYGVTKINVNTNQREYSPLNYHSAWLNAGISKGKWKPSLFVGYTKNCGSDEIITGPVYARNPEIDYVYRIAPMITFVNGKFSFIAELEYTSAAYGTNNEMYKVLNSKETGNFRIDAGIVYSF